MAIRTYTGTPVGPSPSYFRVWVQVETLSYDATGANVRYRYGLEVTAGNFNGTTTTGDFGTVVLYGPKDYTWTEWYPLHINYGSSYTMSVEQQYSNGSRTFKATVSHTESIPALPNAPTNATHTQNSDVQNTISWTASTGGAVEKYVIARSLNGGDFNEIARIDAPATSYIDNTCAPDCYYQYKVGAYAMFPVRYSNATSVTYNTPTAPKSIRGARTIGNVIGFTLENTSATATALELQYSVDGVTDWDGAPSITGSPVTEFTYSNSGTFYYRARNTRGSLVSEWVYTDEPVVVMAKPYPPTIVRPSNGTVYRTNTGPVYEWVHNPSDGTDLTKSSYEIWFTQELSGGSTLAPRLVSSGEVNPGATIGYYAQDAGKYEFKVRTKGAHPDWSDWSSVQYRYDYPPSVSVSIDGLSDGLLLNMPIRYTVNFSDSGGTLASGTLQLMQGDRVVYQRSLDSLTGEITAEDHPCETETQYSLKVTVRSSTTLSATSTLSFTTEFIPPEQADMIIKFDADTGYTEIKHNGYLGDIGHVEAEYTNIYRVVDGEELLLATNMNEGSTFVDRFAPLNKDFYYKVVSFSASGAMFSYNIEENFKTNRFFAYWDGRIAFGIYDPTMSISHSRPQRQLVYYDGRKYPVLYDGMNHSEQYGFSFVIMKFGGGFETWHDLVKSNGVCVFKAATGEVFHACVSTSASYAFEPNEKCGSMSLTVERIDGGAL